MLSGLFTLTLSSSNSSLICATGDLRIDEAALEFREWDGGRALLRAEGAAPGGGGERVCGERGRPFETNEARDVVFASLLLASREERGEAAGVVFLAVDTTEFVFFVPLAVVLEPIVLPLDFTDFAVERGATEASSGMRNCDLFFFLRGPKQAIGEEEAKQIENRNNGFTACVPSAKSGNVCSSSKMRVSQDLLTCAWRHLPRHACFFASRVGFPVSSQSWGPSVLEHWNPGFDLIY